VKKVKILIFGLGFLFYAFFGVWNQVNINPKFPSDIGIYLHAGEKALQGGDPYAPFGIGASFVYPPVALLIFGPLSTFGTAKIIWTCITIISMLLVVTCLLEIVPVEVRRYQAIWLTAVVFLFAPFLEQITIGQINSLVLLGITLFMVGMFNPRLKWLGDIGLALAILLKITPIVLVALPFIRKDWKRCARIGIAAVGFILISIIFLGLMPWKGFLDIFPFLFKGWPVTINEAVGPSLIWLGQLLIPNLDITWTGSAFSIFALVLWLGALFFSRKRGDDLAVLSLGIVVMTISSSIVWYHHLVFLTVPIVYLAYAAQGPGWRDRASFLLLLFGITSITLNRFLETRYLIPPFASICGYLSILAAAVIIVFQKTAEQNAVFSQATLSKE
jgi:Glycosyltransferase family 87